MDVTEARSAADVHGRPGDGEWDYCGSRECGGCVVRVRHGNVDEKISPRLDLWSHSPTGFDWGYAGSGPAQLALAVLADHYRRRGATKTAADRMAIEHHQSFKRAIVAGLPRMAWRLSRHQVDRALQSIHDSEQKARRMAAP